MEEESIHVSLQYCESSGACKREAKMWKHGAADKNLIVNIKALVILKLRGFIPYDCTQHFDSI